MNGARARAPGGTAPNTDPVQQPARPRTLDLALIGNGRIGALIDARA